ncbi:MAG: PadR family transcriptional regulator [Coleofasciculaceae cyanobacterium]
MLELSTLGLLLNEPLHGYLLKQRLELFMSCCISVNYGAIYPLLKRLEQRGEIATLTTDSREAKSRKTYCITAKGRSRWREKMLEHPHESWVNSRSRFTIKFFFFGYLEPDERIILLQHRLKICQLRQATLEVEATPLDNHYASTAWQRALDTLNSEIDWLGEQLANEAVMK